jgi:hypothetical protein
VSADPLSAATDNAGKAVRRLARTVAQARQRPGQLHLEETPEHHDAWLEELELYAEEAEASLDALAQTLRERL